MRKKNFPAKRQQVGTGNTKYLLYIDILGFTDLVLKRGRVEELYGIIDRLNVFQHPNFKAIAFSDTILVYNTHDPKSASDRHYLVMYLCEFAQDLFYRLIRRNIHFRAYLTQGEFNHSVLKNIQAFYGEALIRSHLRERDIQCVGLFIDKILLPDNDIFFTEPYDNDCNFVHLMQRLDDIRFPDVTYPISPELITPMALEFFLIEDFEYLQRVHRNMNDMSLAPRARNKHLAAWQMISKRHRTLLEALEKHNFDPRSISDFDWSEAQKSFDEDK